MKHQTTLQAAVAGLLALRQGVIAGTATKRCPHIGETA